MPIIILILVILALWFGVKLLGFVLLSAIVLGDGLSRVFVNFGAGDPVAGWMILGILVGAAVGFAVGMRRGGRPLSRVVMWLFAGFAMVVLGGASTAATTFAHESGVGVRRVRPHPSFVWIVPEALSVRAAPSPTAPVIGTLTGNTSLHVDSVDATNRWYAVTVRKNSRSIAGWVSSAYVSSTAPSPPPRPVEKSTDPDTFRVATVDVGREIGPDQRIAQRTNEFSSFDTIYAVVATRNAGSGHLGVWWSLEDNPPMQYDSLSLAAHGDATTPFQLSRPEGFASGQYTLHVALNHIEVARRQITVR